MAVARRSGRIIHNSLTHPDQAVEKRTLAHIRTAYYSYKTHNPKIRFLLFADKDTIN